MPDQTTGPQKIGIVTGLTGEAFAESASGARPLAPGSPIYEGEELVTAADGNVEIRLLDDTLLSQGANSRIALDDYIYDDSSGVGDFLANITQGTFRMVTGKIAEQNPDRFKVGTPLATIGIRGTIILSEVGPDGEKHGVEEIHAGKAMLLQSKVTGAMRQLFSGQIVDVSGSGLLSSVRPLSARELQNFRKVAPANIRQEQDIREPQDDKQQDDQINEQIDEQQEELSGDVSPGGGTPSEDPGVDGGVLHANKGVFEHEEKGLADQKRFEPEKIGEKPEPNDKPDTGEDKKPEKQNGEREGELLEKADSTKGETGEGPKEAKPTVEPVLDETGEPESTTDSDSPSEPESDPHNITGSGLIEGTLEADTITGSSSSDTIRGFAGNDTLYGKDGNDTLQGAEGSDTLLGGVGNDDLDGGTGLSTEVDFVSYAEATGSVTASLQSGSSSGADGSDTLSNFEGIIGSVHDDTLDGDSANNTLRGNSGKDTLTGGEGDDHLDGGAGIDFVSYAGAGASVSVDLLNGTTSGAHGQDTIENIEGITGSTHDDTLDGDNADNTIYGNDGVDTIHGGGGADTLVGGAGNDSLYGDGGIDTVSYAGASGGVTVDLSLNTATGADGNDTLSSIENVIGSSHADNITGDSGGNIFVDTDSADDAYNGGLGTDTVDYSGRGSAVQALFDQNKVSYGMMQFDTITSIEIVIGTQYDDSFQIGDSNATMHAGEGTDHMHCASLSASVSINNSNGTATSGSYTYAFSGIETFFGTGIPAGGDVFIGNTSGSETVDLGEGSDTFTLYNNAATTIEYGSLYTNADTINNFNSGEDKFLFTDMMTFDNTAGFKADGTVSGSTSAYFIYESNKLYYDADGDGSGDSPVLIADVNGDAVQQSDITFSW
ncbi:FecR domain-containing protein [Desulfovibrio sp. JC022]|uniref:FecR domain-containing protein n=1 Tax=Desulfovibrio sp. JC022 TaxID=2593642 RepID=UPI0013D00D77|nr:FecR domain-containing protein [Desulfovibrio sp. JC022]